jgi:hypothetical protein
MKPTNENITTLPIKDFAKKIICDGHLFMTGKEGRRFYLMQPGMLVDEDFIKKHALHNTVFEFDSVTNKETIQKFSKLFRELKYLQFEKDLRQKSVEIANCFHETFSNENHILNFALACFQEFSLVPAETLKKMHSVDINLFRKSLYSASFAVITAITSDFYHYTMLRDFFNLTFTLDFGLCDSSYSYYVARACNHENRFPGSGEQWMRDEKATELEVKVFLNHPKKSYEFLKSSKMMAFPELCEITLYQHELSNGKGFPRKITKGQVSSWEAVVLFADSLVEIEDSFNFERQVVKHLTEFQNTKLNELPVGRVHQKLCKAFRYFEVLKETGT